MPSPLAHSSFLPAKNTAVILKYAYYTRNVVKKQSKATTARQRLFETIVLFCKFVQTEASFGLNA